MKFLEQIKENEDSLYRLGYDRFSEKYILEITDTFDYRYFTLTEKQYDLFEENFDKFEHLVQKYAKESSRCKAFFFSTRWKENTPKQEKLHWKYIYIDLLLGRTRKETHALIGMPDLITPDPEEEPDACSRTELYRMSNELDVQVLYEGELCIHVEVSFTS